MRFNSDALNSPTIHLTSNNKVCMINQKELPEREVYEEYFTYIEVAGAIRDMIIRGAPAIGIAGAYGYYLGALEFYSSASEKKEFLNSMDEVYRVLAETRPTAVNLFWALDEMKKHLQEFLDSQNLMEILRKKAIQIHQDDIERCRKIGENGKVVLKSGMRILTHCNAGALATGNYGTALGVIRAGWEEFRDIEVFADETRPFFQGSRLTAWELNEDNIPVTVICDNMAGYLMQQGKIDIIITGADRIAMNGDSANKIGTYSLAVLAEKHGIPFYIAAPLSTVDWNISTGKEIIIENRSAEEVKKIKGNLFCPEQVNALHPGFDVTPADLITGIITEQGIITPFFRDKFQKIKDTMCTV